MPSETMLFAVAATVVAVLFATVSLARRRGRRNRRDRTLGSGRMRE